MYQCYFASHNSLSLSRARARARTRTHTHKEILTGYRIWYYRMH